MEKEIRAKIIGAQTIQDCTKLRVEGARQALVDAFYDIGIPSDDLKKALEIINDTLRKNEENMNEVCEEYVEFLRRSL